MGVFVKHEPCPKCGSRDNLGRYADGSAWCFGCGYIERRDRIPLFHVEKDDELVQLDDDLCLDFPGHVVEWLAGYGISVPEALKHGWKYSPHRDQLVYIFRDEAGRVQATQARNFWKGAKVKYFTQGSIESLVPVFRCGRSSSSLDEGETRRLVVVEDVVSAAKIARQASAMPLLGSTLSNTKLARLAALKPLQMVFWLDYDKWTSAVKMADRAKLLGMNTKVVQTEKDPKEYSDAEITCWLENS